MDKWQAEQSFKSAILKGIAALGLAAMTISCFAGSVSAQSLLDKIKHGETIRVGFASDPPSAYPGENNAPLGFVNAMALEILKKLGTTKVEPIVTEWGSLIPGLQAGRFDIITGGMYILPERCRNVLFTEPLAKFTEALLVPNGNPKELHSFDDIRDKGLTLVTTAGSDTVKNAKDAGIPEDRVMQVAGQAEFLQAVKVGRAAAGSLNYFTVKELADKDHSVEMADPFTPPAGKAGYPSLAFLPNQQAAVDAFNEILKTYIGSEEMMQSVGKYGYTKINLPDGTKTVDLCKG